MERRKRAVAYAYTTCLVCVTVEDQIMEGKTRHVRVQTGSLRGALRSMADWAWRKRQGS